MRIDQYLAAKTEAQRIRPPLEYPKYIDVGGKPVLALSEDHGLELLTSAKPADLSPDNLLSAPGKRDIRSKGA